MLKRTITGHTSKESTKAGHPGYKLGHLYIFIFRHTLTHTHICTHTHTDTHMNKHTDTHKNRHTHEQTHTEIHNIYTCI